MNDTPGVIYIGESHDPHSSEAGQQAARMARGKMKTRSSAAWALVLCGGKQDPHSFLQGLRSQIGDVEIAGGASVGTITNRSIGRSKQVGNWVESEGEGTGRVFRFTIPIPV